MRGLAPILSLFSLAARRLWNQRLLMLCLLLGLVAAVGLLSSIPLYADAAQNRLLQGELQTVDTASGTEAATVRPPFAFLWRYIGAWHGNVTWETYGPVDAYLTEQAPTIVDLPVEMQIRHVATDKMRLFPSEDAAFVPDEPLLWASIGFVTGLQDHIQIVEGAFPAEHQAGEQVEVLVSRTTADLLGLQVGEVYTLFATSQAGAQIPVLIAGVWQAADPSDPSWFYQPDAFDEMLLTSDGAFVDQVVPALDEPVATAVWYQIYDGSRVRPATVSGLLENVAVVESRVTVLLNNATLDVSPVPALQSYGESASVLTLVLTIFSLPVIGLVVYFISLIAGMVVRRGQSEIAIMRSRGISRRKIVNLYLLEGLLLGSLGLVAGLLLGRWMAQLMSHTHTFLDPRLLTGDVLSSNGGQPMAIVFTPTSLAYALVGVALTLFALLIPALLVSQHSIVTKGLFTLSQVPNLQEGRLIGHNQGYSMINERNELQPIIRTLQVTRVYHVDSREIPALRGVDLSIGPGQVVALRGRSGSGKTTLLNCIGGLDRPTSGEVWFEGTKVTYLSEGKWVDLRRHRIGFVFQSHALLATYSAWENVDLMLRLAGVKRRQRQERAEEVLTLMGLTKWREHRTFELSGGQQQRVAIARAIAPYPSLILADEPTGELDTATGQQILQLFRRIADQDGTTVLIATHDLAVDAFADAVYHLQDGRIVDGQGQKATTRHSLDGGS